MVPLLFSTPGEENIIRRVGGNPAVKKHLEDMGFVVGGAVTVLSSIGGDLIVKVEAPQGAFPTGAKMRLEWVEDENTLNAIENAVEGDVEVKAVKAVDITFLDADGNEIEPLKPIHVSMRDALVEQAENVEVVHVNDQGEAEVRLACGGAETAGAAWKRFPASIIRRLNSAPRSTSQFSSPA